MNEAFNQVCTTWFAPKNKAFAGTGSLNNRIASAVGINSLGVDAFFRRLFKKLGIPLTDNVSYWLKTKEQSHARRLAKLKTQEAKLKKSKGKRELLAKHTQIAKLERHKREGMYRSGMNLDDPLLMRMRMVVASLRPQKEPSEQQQPSSARTVVARIMYSSEARSAQSPIPP
jgi:hypothetical protein